MLDLGDHQANSTDWMMNYANLHLNPAPAQASWSKRVLVLSLAGIFFLTLYPFRFVHQESTRFLFPFSLNGWGKGIEALDIFLNVLLFVPFGFGFAEELRENGRSKLATFWTVYAAGAVLSYAVEFAQIYIPPRDSGWTDVITNSAGAAIGCLLYERAGAGIIEWFSGRERAMDASLTLGRIGVLVGLYVGIWCVLGGPLQKQTKLAHWTSDSYLAVGDSASLRPPPAWKGRIVELEFWNHAVPGKLAQKITSDTAGDLGSPGALATYRFSGAAPFRDSRDFLPSFAWASQAPSSMTGDGAMLNGSSWLISAGPVPTLVNSVESTGQFALHVVCEPGESNVEDARIVSLSSPSGKVDMELRQTGSELIFWFQNPFSTRRARMSWIVPQVFAPQQMRNLLLSFDGSKLSLFLDGNTYGYPYELGPGVALAKYIRHVKAVELKGYGYIFYAMIFCPAGCLLGFAWRKRSVSWRRRLIFLACGFLLPAIVLEWVLADAAGRSFSFRNIFFSVVLALAASLWMNADRVFSHSLHAQREAVSAR